MNQYHPVSTPEPQNQDKSPLDKTDENISIGTGSFSRVRLKMWLEKLGIPLTLMAVLGAGVLFTRQQALTKQDVRSHAQSPMTPITPPTQTPTSTPSSTSTPTPSPQPTPTPTPKPFSLTNGSFEIDNDNNGVPDNWTKSGNMTSNDIRIATPSAPLGGYVFQFAPVTTTKFKSLTQTKAATGVAGDQWQFRVWNKVENIGSGGIARVRISFVPASGTGSATNVSTNLVKDSNGRYQTATVNAPSSYKNIRMVLESSVNSGFVFFDDVSLIKL